jgi:PAS domain S-box-containing protein
MPHRNIPDDDEQIELQRYKLLVSSIADYAIYMLDGEGRVVSWNTGAQRIKGYTAQEVIGKHFSLFHSEEDQAAGIPSASLQRSAMEGKYESEGWRVRKDGSRFWATVVIDPISDGSGALLGYAQITRDITDRRDAAEALRQSEQQLRLLVEGVTDYAIYMLDTSGHITNWNAGAQRIKGYTAKEVLGTHFSRFYTETDREAGIPEKALRIAKSEGRFEQEGLRVRKDGSRFLAHVIIDAIRNEDGTFLGFAKVTRDITEKEEARAALQRTERALQKAQKMETIGKLTGGVAHDFNNLLQVISGNLQLLAIDLAGNERALRRLNNAMDGVNRGAKLASHLLAFGRRQALAPKVVNIGRVLAGLDDILQRSLGEAIEVETMVNGGLWNSFVDTTQVENALLNLAINARDAMEGSGKLTIEIGNAYLDDAYASAHAEVSPGQYVMIAVTDTGSGMTPEVMAQAFEPFFSTKPEGKGSGLGLSMVYGFVKQSGGHITLYSELGHGTTVRMYLPRSLESEDLAPTGDTKLVSGGTETILVAEDDEQVCATVVETLQGLGYQVLQASDATAALAVIQSGMHIDLLFTDVVMPGPLRSPDLARKARERLPNLAVLFTSGYTQNAIVHGGRLDPGVELLSKPYSRSDLARKVRHVIANRKKQKPALSTLVAPPAQNRPLQGIRRLRIALVEDNDLIRSNAAELIEDLGHSVFQLADARQALAWLESDVADVIIADIGLPDMSGADLVRLVREKFPTMGIVFATGQDAPTDVQGAALLLKPYDGAAIAAVLRQFARGS